MKKKKTNFIFFFPDEMRADSVSCYGSPVVKMPNYNRLAKEGVRFDKCFVQNPVCSPSRCSLMTGLYVHSLGHRTLWHLLRKHEPSLFRYLKQAGYRIQWYGKNDLYASEYIEEVVDNVQELKVKKNVPKSQSKVLGNPYDIDDVRYYSFLYNPVPEGKGCAGNLEQNIRKAIEFLKSQKDADQPFMLFLPLGMPHPPYQVPEYYYNMYNPDELPSLRPVVENVKPSYHKLIPKYRSINQLPEDFMKKIQAVYLGMNSYVDTMLGELLDALDDTGLSEETTVIASSDHGDWAGDYGLVEKWPNAFDDLITRVPLIIRTPDNKKGHVVNEQVELFDIMATIMELAGVQPTHTHFAQSLVPQLNGKPGDPERAVFSEGGYNIHEPHCFEGFIGRKDKLRDPSNIYFPKAKQQQEHPESVCRSAMIRTLDYKLVRRSADINELYDLKNDPFELSNVYNDTKYSDVRVDMESRLLDWYLSTSDIVPHDDNLRTF